MITTLIASLTFIVSLVPVVAARHVQTVLYSETRQLLVLRPALPNRLVDRTEFVFNVILTLPHAEDSVGIGPGLALCELLSGLLAIGYRFKHALLIWESYILAVGFFDGNAEAFLYLCLLHSSIGC